MDYAYARHLIYCFNGCAASLFTPASLLLKYVSCFVSLEDFPNWCERIRDQKTSDHALVMFGPLIGH